MKKIYTLVASLLIAGVSMAQTPAIKSCYTEENRIELAKKDPSSEIKRAAYEAELDNYIAANKNNKQAQVNKIIPVVVHVLHVGGIENISKAQIDDQIRILNEAYSFTNANKTNIPSQMLPICGAANIEFRLANLDPNGNCTDGVTRTYTNLTNQTANRDDVKGVIYWPSNKYLNIWLVKGIESSGGTTGGIILGYAQFPGTGSATTDGLVVRHDYFGTIGTASAADLGSTTVHEAGHWFNLRHIWGDQPCGNDLVADTPIHEGANQSFCPVYPWHPNNTCGGGPDGEMYFNYMDYTTGACQAAFSNGQGTRMNAALNSSTSGRNNLWSAGNLTATGVANATPNACAPKAEYTPTNYKIICKGQSVIFNDNSYNGVPTSYSWSFQGGTPSTSTNVTDTIVYTTPGVYDVTYIATNAFGSSTKTKTGYIVVTDDIATPATVYSEGFEDPSTFAQKWIAINKDNDVAKFQNSAATGFTGTHSMVLNNFFSKSKLSDEVLSPPIDFTNVNSAQLSFRYAFATQTSTDKDKLELYVQTDCNLGFVGTSKFTKTANAAGTSNLSPVANNDVFSNYVPVVGDATEWKQATVNIGAIANKPFVRFKFVFTGGNGNNFYVDDVQITSLVTNVKNTATLINSFSVSPNPATTQATINFELDKNSPVELNVTNLLGQTVTKVFAGSLNQGAHNYEINTSKLTSGVYMIVLTSNGSKTVKKLIVE